MPASPDAEPAEDDVAGDQWQKIYDVNVTGVFLSCQAEARAMLPRGKGAIVNIASMSGSIVNRGLTQAHYNSSKAAVIHMSKSLAMEWADRGLRVNVISPGYTLTPMNRRPEGRRAGEDLRARHADGPHGDAARRWSARRVPGRAAPRLSSPASTCIVDGGFVCW